MASSKASTPETAESRRKSATSAAQSSRNLRETVESIAIAFILAFLFRTFEAEAFVIPTGSMAPTLQGQHKDLLCPQCDFRYRASASSEASEEVSADIVSATCPMCRYPLRMENDPAVPSAQSRRPTTAIAFWSASSPTSSTSRNAGT